jgi:hypothetical protein
VADLVKKDNKDLDRVDEYGIPQSPDADKIEKEAHQKVDAFLGRRTHELGSLG